MNDQVSLSETTELLRLASEALALPGDFVEFGCYRGDTSVLLGKLLVENSIETCGKPVDNSPKSSHPNLLEPLQKSLYLYDSFAGLPEKSPEDSSSAGENFKKGELFVSKREVVAKLRRAGLKNTIIKKAWFDDLTPADLPREISFAFLDGDLYSSIKTSLRLVFPLLTKGGIMVIHDYNNPELPGSTRAVDEFLRAHPDFRLFQKSTLAILRRKC